MKKLISSTIVLLLAAVFSVNSWGADGDLFIQVDLPGLNPEGCSIMKVTPEGVISQFISNAQILAVTGDTEADCDDTGLAVGLNGKVYFNEDEEDNILVATPSGQLSIFITDTVVDSIVPGDNDVDWDNGLAISPGNGNLFAADEDNEIIFEFPTNVPTPITDTSLIKILADKADFQQLVTTVDLEGGIAVDFVNNVYITNDDSDNDLDNVIFKLTRSGDLSILCTQDELLAAAGVGQIDLDVGAVFGGKLYVADDGNCDCVFEIDTETCDPVVIVEEDDITAATENPGANLEGGLCIDAQRNLYMGDDGSNQPNIVRSPFDARSNVSLFVSDSEIDSFYSSVEPGSNPQLRGSCSVEGGFDPGVRPIPTLSEWGLIAMALVLGIVGFIAVRRRMVKA